MTTLKGVQINREILPILWKELNPRTAMCTTMAVSFENIFMAKVETETALTEIYTRANKTIKWL